MIDIKLPCVLNFIKDAQGKPKIFLNMNQLNSFILLNNLQNKKYRIIKVLAGSYTKENCFTIALIEKN